MGVRRACVASRVGGGGTVDFFYIFNYTAGDREKNMYNIPLDKDYYSNQQMPPGILLGLSSSFKKIKDSNGQRP